MRAASRSVAFSPDSRHLLSCDATGLIVQWDVRTGEHEPPLRHRREDDTVVAAANNLEPFKGTIATYAQGGRTIVSAGQDQWVMVWDAATHQPRAKVQIATNIFGFSNTKDGRDLALAEQVPIIELLDLEKPYEPRRSLRAASNHVTAVVFSPDGRILAMAGYGNAGLLDSQSGRILDVFDYPVNQSPYALAFGPAGDSLAMAVGDEIHVVRLLPSHDGATIAASPGPIVKLAVSPDERLLALARKDGTILVWSLRAKRVLQTLSGHDRAVFGAAFVPGPGAARLVSVGGDGLVKIWDAEAGGEPLHTLSGNSGSGGAVYAVAVRRDGRQIAAGGVDGIVRTWDPVTGRRALPSIDHRASISALAYDPTGTSLASGGMDSTVQVWYATSGRRRLGPLSHKYQISSLAFSPDGRLLAGGGGARDMGGIIQIWDSASGTMLPPVDCPRGIDSLSFSPDSQRIATCGSDSVVQIWDFTGGAETLSLDGGGGRVSDVFFAREDLRLYSAGRDGVVKLWDGSSKTSQ